MSPPAECPTMPPKKKKSEARKHTSMIRISPHAHNRASLAADLMRMSLADYASDVLLRSAERDIVREAKKLTGGES